MRTHSIKSTVTPFLAAFGLLALFLNTPSSRAADIDKCPFGSLGSHPMLAVSFQSWNDYWALYGAPTLAAEVFESLHEEVLPALLKISEATGPVRDLPATLRDLMNCVDWEPLARSTLTAVVYADQEDLPQSAFRITPPPGMADRAFSEIEKLAAVAVAPASPAFQWKADGNRGALCPASVTGEDAVTEGSELLSLWREEGSIWLAPGSPKPVQGSGGFAALPDFVQLWKEVPSSPVVSAAINFGEVARVAQVWAHRLIFPGTREEDKAWTSSLVLDETMERLFSDDLETLEKLEETQSGFEELTGKNQSEFRAAVDQGLELLSDQGLVVATINQVQRGALETVLWHPREGSDGAILCEAASLSPAFLGLLQPGKVEVSLRGLPPWSRLHQIVLDLIRLLPGSEEGLNQWEEFQESIGFSVEKDLLPALGREAAWVVDQPAKGTGSSFQVFSSELHFALAIADLPAARRTLDWLENEMREYGLAVSATRVEDVTFSVLDTGLAGKGAWGLIPQPPAFILSTGDPQGSIKEFLGTLLPGNTPALNQTPRWEAIKSIWREQPTAVTLADPSVTWEDLTGQLKTGQMMLAMMGPAGSAALPFVHLALKVLQAVEPPDCLFRVDSNEGGNRISRSLVLFPEKGSSPDSEP